MRKQLMMVLASAATLAACESEIVRPDGARPAASLEGIEARATGAGHLLAANGELRKFSFSAVTHADGTVSGQFELVAGNADLVAHGTVTCMAVVDGQAWIGGTLDRNSIGAPFTHGWWRAVDGGTDAPDQLSVLVVANDPAGGLAQAFCDGRPTGFPPLNDIVQGAITID